MKKLQLINSLQEAAEQIQYSDDVALDALLRRGEMIIRNLFGVDSHYLQAMQDIRFSPRGDPWEGNAAAHCWNDGISQLKNFFSTMAEEITLFSEPSSCDPDLATPCSLKIFIVHGHDETMKQSAARTITQLGLDPIILHEQANQGKTVIEKFKDFSDVGFALILLSPDDLARSKQEAYSELRPRARQNVIFELGYFIGQLGRKRVAVLHRVEPNFEMPSDYSGVVFIPFDEGGAWKFTIVRELKASDYEVDANNLIR